MNLLECFTLEQRRNFVMRHARQLTAWQQPEMLPELQSAIADASEDWVDDWCGEFVFNPDAVKK